MRILAIRGCNLASLAGEFELDLARAPFCDAGVFAIVGNTGAGKSTLLDALCVALFDRTPRLTNHSRVIVGRGDDDPGALGAQDARTLLRRGASAGYAEVDFESGDARRYRARWSVRRARNQTDGTLQDQQLTLTAIDGDVNERLGGTKTETLKAIVARLGLSFDQFRRSALLAQGEFAAFLRADGKDRSELLERMTGTEIYSRLSVAAHLRATLAEQRFREGRAAAYAIPVLDDESRIEAIAELAIAEVGKLAARARLATAEATERWRTEAQARAAARRAAETEHAAANHAVDTAMADRQELALRQRADRLRAPWEAVARIERALAVLQGDVAGAERAVAEASERRAVTSEQRGVIGELHVPIRAARIAARLVERPVSEGARADAAVIAEARAALVDAVWLGERPGIAAEIGTSSELDARFAQHAATGDVIGSIDRALAGHESTRAAHTATRTLVAGEHAAMIAKLADAQAKVARYQQRRGLTLEAARRNEDEARTRLLEVERLVAIAAGARSAVRAGVELERQLAEIDSATVADAGHRREAETARAIAGALRDDRARVVDELRRAAGYEHARAELREGEACPLCGALEHPWRDRGALHGMIEGAQTSFVEVTLQLDTLAATLAAIAAREQQRLREAARLTSHRATAAASAAGATAIWRDHLAALGELVFEHDPASPDAERLAADREAAAKQRLEQARDTRRQTEASAKAAAEAQAEVQLVQTTVDQLAARLAEAARALADLEATAERLRGERAGRVERLAELATSCNAAIATWLGRPHDFAQARPAIAELAVEWRTRGERVAGAEAALAAALAASDRELRQCERVVVEHGAVLAAAAGRRDVLIRELAEATAVLEAARLESGFDREELWRLLASDGGSRIAELVEQLGALDREVERTRAIVQERVLSVEHHAAVEPARADLAPVAELAAAVAVADHEAARLAAMITADSDARERRTAALAQLADGEAHANVDRILGEVIGSHDGKLFRSFAQSLTLDGLLAVANAHLEELAPRYQLERVPRHDLELQVIDRDLGSEVRSVQSLSGGESFLVSLALALGLSSMSAHDVRVRTLLIDEGFGTLDPATLDGALSVLDALQATGRQVGVISHVPALVERVGAHVRVVQRGGGRSEVIVS
ncbi:MAG: AAA family ATPase [Kofleriaceae bacterium]